jgi:tight adherence protein C
MVIVIVILTFAGIALAVMSVYWMFSRPTNIVTSRLESMDPSLALVENNPISEMAERVAEPLNRIVPISAIEAEKLQKQLLQAGYRSPDAAMVYRAIQLTSLIAFPSIVLTACWITNQSTNNCFLLGGMAVGIGFYLPRFVLRRRITSRQRRVSWGLADALDLLVVAIEAGLGLNAALVRIGDELKTLHVDMHNELELVNLEIRVGRSREEALRNLAERTGVEDIRSFVALLVQADRYGSSIGKAVRVFAESLRTKRRQRAEQAAQKAALKLLIPLTLFLFPVVIVVVLAPPILTLIDILGK